jgi:hypothetical protein
MAGQSVMLSRKESIALQRNIEYGPNKTQSGSASPNHGTGGMDVKVQGPKK